MTASTSPRSGFLGGQRQKCACRVRSAARRRSASISASPISGPTTSLSLPTAVAPPGRFRQGQPAHDPRVRQARSTASRSAAAGAGWSRRSFPRFRLDASGRVVTTQRHGPEQFLADLNLAYRGRPASLRRDVRWSVQLNVNNVFDNRGLCPALDVARGRADSLPLQLRPASG